VVLQEALHHDHLPQQCDPIDDDHLLTFMMVYGVWCMAYGVWRMVYGVWCMVYGVWCMVYGVL